MHLFKKKLKIILIFKEVNKVGTDVCKKSGPGTGKPRQLLFICTKNNLSLISLLIILT